MGAAGGAGRDRLDGGRRSRCSPACSAWPARRSTSSRSTARRHVAKPADETVSGRWAHHVGSHPVRYAIVGLGALCAIAVPALSMRIGVPDDGNAPTAHDPAHRLRPAGRRLRTRVQRPDPGRRRAPDTGRPRRSSQRVHDALQADPGVAAVTAPVFNAAGDTAVLTANPTTAPQDERTDQLVRHLRSDVLPGDGRRHRRAGCRSPARRWSPT